jgi:hypothetical protein
MTLIASKPEFAFHKDGTMAPPQHVFVFGSNLSGIHGAGAAKYANQVLKYPWGIFEGLTNGAYGIPTKDADIGFMELEKIRPFVERFCDHTHRNPQNRYFVTRVGCVLAGHEDRHMAALFREAAANCSFAEEWRPYLTP